LREIILEFHFKIFHKKIDFFNNYINIIKIIIDNVYF